MSDGIIFNEVAPSIALLPMHSELSKLKSASISRISRSFSTNVIHAIFSSIAERLNSHLQSDEPHLKASSVVLTKIDAS